MKYIDEFRSKPLITKLSTEIKAAAECCGQINIMEVCGTHTMSFFRFGLRKLLPENLRLVSGPGCPVCVSPQEYIDSAITLAKKKNIIIATFGDMLRVPGTHLSLEKLRAEGADISVVYSALDALKIARKNPAKKVIFLAVGFETTIPTVALSILLAEKEKINNIFFLCSLKLIPPALSCLLTDKRLNISAFLLPGHVSAIIGTRPYEFIAEKYKIPCCVSGFEPVDILEGIYFLLKQIKQNKPIVANQYKRVVRKEGNVSAQKTTSAVFKISSAQWRGLGKIPASGLMINSRYSRFDAGKTFGIKRIAHNAKRTARCRCSDVLKGIISPLGCPLFSKACQPDNPLGPCMVSSEGACNAYYKYA